MDKEMNYKQIIDKILEQTRNNQDCIILIDGEERAGMSFFAMEINRIYRQALKEERCKYK